MRHQQKKLIVLLLSAGVLVCTGAGAEVIRSTMGPDVVMVKVSDDAWQPDNFKQGTVIPAAYASDENIVLDGIDDEPEWAGAEEVTIALSFGNVESARLKALYTDEDVLLRVRWADTAKDSLHRPWVWDAKAQKYVAGPQAEDSLLLSFEAGCEWFPSFLSGYDFDFDAWHWQAARTDPVGRALDLNGSVNNKRMPRDTAYASRNKEDEWNLRITDRNDGIFHHSWDKLDRRYMLWPVMETVYYGARLDGVSTLESERNSTSLAGPPSAPPSSPAPPVPQFEPVELTGNAGDVAAKGHWEDGFWTVEFRRKRFTEGGGAWDVQFHRLSQFSLHVFDGTEQLDQSSESPRLFLQFLEKKPLLANQ
jgi:hypothetical protein